MADPSKNHSLHHLRSYPSSLRRAVHGLFSLNLNSLRVLLRDGPSNALSFVSHSYLLYPGFGLPRRWQRSPWRKDLGIPMRKLEEPFPEMDCTRSLELLFHFPRDLGVLPQELIVLTKVVDYLKAKRVVEFGTAEGRTALNIALHLPPDGEIITLDFPPIPGQNEIGFFTGISRSNLESSRSSPAWKPGIAAPIALRRRWSSAMPATPCQGLPRKHIRPFP